MEVHVHKCTGGWKGDQGASPVMTLRGRHTEKDEEGSGGGRMVKIHTCTCMSTHIHAHTHSCTNARIHSRTHTRTNFHMHTSIVAQTTAAANGADVPASS